MANRYSEIYKGMYYCVPILNINTEIIRLWLCVVYTAVYRAQNYTHYTQESDNEINEK